MLAGILTGGSALPPASANLVAQWSAKTITPQSDNTALASWTDSVNGIVANQGTGVNQPKYRTNRMGGNPSVQFAGSNWLGIASPGVMKTAIDTKIYTVVVAMNNPAGAGANSTVFGSWASGTNYLIMTANASRVGLFDPGSSNQRSVPYTGGAAFCVLGQTSTNVFPGATSGGANRVYVNGGCVTVQPSPGFASGDASFGIGASSTAGTNPSTCEIYEVMVWNVALTPLQMLQVESYLCTKYGQVAPYSTASKFDVYDGDSLTQGQGSGGGGFTLPESTYPYLSAAARGLSYGQWTLTAVAGINTNQMTNKLSEWTGIAAQIGKPVKVAAWEWINDFNAARDPSADIAAYAAAVRATANTKLSLGTSVSYNLDPKAERITYNSYCDTNSASLCDAYVPLHNNASIGNTSAYGTNSATYWADTIHLNAAGYAALAPLMTAGLNTL